jgi:hypothetical protein
MTPGARLPEVIAGFSIMLRKSRLYLVIVENFVLFSAYLLNIFSILN